jgi:hypothetical protein
MPGSPRSLFAMDQRDTVRRTICVGSWAAKIARNGTGRRCNSFEADLWARTSARRRAMLCPVLARLPFGVAILMPCAEPLSEDEADHLRATRGFPDWDYVPPDESEPFEYKASDWGRLPGRSACCVGLFGTGTRLMGRPTREAAMAAFAKGWRRE